MLLEALNFLATLATSPRKLRGEINSSVMLWARARRCSRDWALHEQNCHEFIRQMVEKIENKRTVVVLGSGLLRDVPIAELSAQFEKVILVDLQHLASVRLWAKARRLKNIEFINRDFSGIDQFDEMPEPLAFLLDVDDLDLVISANVLSQIGVGLTRLKESNDETLQDFSIPKLLAAHVEGLEKLAISACLLTDVSYKVLDKSGAMIEDGDLMQGAILPKAEREWDWTVIPFGEQSPDWRAIHRVAAIRITAA